MTRLLSLSAVFIAALTFAHLSDKAMSEVIYHNLNYSCGAC